MLFPSLTLVIVSLFNVFTCRHFEFSNSLSGTLLKCEDTFTHGGARLLKQKEKSIFHDAGEEVFDLSEDLGVVADTNKTNID